MDNRRERERDWESIARRPGCRTRNFFLVWQGRVATTFSIWYYLCSIYILRERLLRVGAATTTFSSKTRVIEFTIFLLHAVWLYCFDASQRYTISPRVSRFRSCFYYNNIVLILYGAGDLYFRLNIFTITILNVYSIGYTNFLYVILYSILH